MKRAKPAATEGVKHDLVILSFRLVCGAVRSYSGSVPAGEAAPDLRSLVSIRSGLCLMAVYRCSNIRFVIDMERLEMYLVVITYDRLKIHSAATFDSMDAVRVALIAFSPAHSFSTLVFKLNPESEIYEEIFPEV